MKLRIWGLLATAAFAALCIHSKREAAMKTLSIVAITAFAFLGLANFASAQEELLQVSSTAFVSCPDTLTIPSAANCPASSTLPITAIYNRTREAAGGGLVNECSPDGAMGENRSPQLSWTNVPTGFTSFAVVGYDREADDYAWGMYNIPGTTRSLPENAGAADSEIGTKTVNMYNRLGYGGPCPAATMDLGPHLLVFTVYALRQPLTASQVGLNASARALVATLGRLGSCSDLTPCGSIAGRWPSPTP